MVTGGVGRCGQVFATYLAWASTRLLYRGGTQLHLAGRGGLISVEGVRAFVRWVGNRSVIGFTVFDYLATSSHSTYRFSPMVTFIQCNHSAY